MKLSARVFINPEGDLVQADPIVLLNGLGDTSDSSVLHLEKGYFRNLNISQDQPARFFYASENQFFLAKHAQTAHLEDGNRELLLEFVQSPEHLLTQEWIDFNTHQQKLASYRKIRIAFVDVYGQLIWSNNPLGESIPESPSEVSDIIKGKENVYYSQLFDAWNSGETSIGYYTQADYNFRLLITPVALNADHLAGFIIEIRQDAPNSNLSVEQLARFPIENPNPVFRVDLSGDLQFANPAAIKKFTDASGQLTPYVAERLKPALVQLAHSSDVVQVRIELEAVTHLATLSRMGNHVNVFTSNITNSVQLENENTQSLAVLEAVVNSSKNSIILLDRDKKITFFNQNAKVESRRHFGYLLQVGDLLPDFEESGFSKTLDRSIEAVYDGGKQLSFDVSMTAGEGETLWFNFTINPVLSPNGRISMVCLTILNVTKSKLAEIETKQTKAFYETILNNIPADIAVFDNHQNYLFINPIAIKDESIRKWMIGKNDYDYFKRKGLDFAIADSRRAIFNDVVQNKTTQEIIDHHVRADGNENYVLRRFYPLVEDGEVNLVIGYGIDISEVKSAEKKARLSETKFKSLFENNPMLLFIVDEQFIIQSTNHAAIDHFQLPAEEIPGMSFLDLMSNDFCNEFTEKFQDAFQMQVNESHSCYCQLNYNNQNYTVEFTATPVFGEAGEKLLLLAGADHSERIRSQEKLRLSEEFNRNLVRDMPIPFAVVNWDKAEYINNACRALVGLSENDPFDGENLLRYVVEEDIPIVLHKFRNRDSGSQESTIMVRLRTHSGLIKNVEIQGGWMNVDGRRLNFVTFVDKTDEIKLSKARLSAELRTKQIIETALDAVVTTNSKGEIQDWNPKAEEIFEWTAQEAVGKNIEETIIPMKFRHAHHKGMEHHMLTGESRVLNRQLQLTAVSKSGKLFPIELFITRIEVEGEVLFSSFIRDVTAQKIAQDALRESENKLSMLVSALPVVPYTAISKSFYEFSYLNDRVVTLLGYSIEEILSERLFWMSQVVVDDLPIIKTGHKELLARGEANIQYRIRHASGKLIWVMDSMRMIVSQQEGDPYMITGVFQDITIQKEEEERRRLIEMTLFEISREELSARNTLEEFYQTVYNRLKSNLGISGMSVWEYTGVNHEFTCTTCYSDRVLACKNAIGSKIKSATLVSQITQFNTLQSNSNLATGDSDDNLNQIFRKAPSVSLLLGVVKTSDLKESIILLESDKNDFVWEYEHSNLISSIAELASVNIEYFQRLEADGKLREAYQLAKIGAWEVEQETNRAFWSEAMFEFYNLNPQMSMPLHFEEAVMYHHPDDRLLFKQAFDGLMQEGKAYNITCRHLFEDGSVRYFEKSAMARKNSNNKVLFMGVTVDITEKKLAELEKDRSKRKQIVRNALISALSTVESQSELFNTFAELLVHSKIVVGCYLFNRKDFTDKSSGYQIANHFPKDIQTDEFLELDVAGLIRDKFHHLPANAVEQLKSFSESYLITALPFKEEVTRYVVFQLQPDEIDFTEKIEIISDLLKIKQERFGRIVADAKVRELNAELVETNIQLRQYSFIVSHNLRAPVANILGCLNIYNQDDYSDPKNTRIFEGMKIAANSVDNILQDLNKILNVKENVSTQFEYVSFQDVLDLVLDSLQEEIQTSACELRVDFSKQAGMQVFKPYLVSIFQNLISNAVRYRDPARQLVLTIDAMSSEGKIEIRFSDTGRGIDMKKNGGRLFKLYSRLHSDVPGTGLGLNMVQEQARAMGGSIQIDSTLGVGSSFTVTFVSKV